MKIWNHLISSYLAFVVSGLSSYDFKLNKSNSKTGMLFPSRFWKDRVLISTNIVMMPCNPVAEFGYFYYLDVTVLFSKTTE